MNRPLPEYTGPQMRSIVDALLPVLSPISPDSHVEIRGAETLIEAGIIIDGVPFNLVLEPWRRENDDDPPVHVENNRNTPAPPTDAEMVAAMSLADDLGVTFNKFGVRAAAFALRRYHEGMSGGLPPALPDADPSLPVTNDGVAAAMMRLFEMKQAEQERLGKQINGPVPGRPSLTSHDRAEIERQVAHAIALACREGKPVVIRINP